ncbi:MAG: enoyl-CoA hydratase/isomerase family protein [Desulfovibrio sp.]|jgi:enoyl-CoA hydratase|nr:enoyl-CoA hydratase/isomerase family protein [Desulfovibrio sp.]
MGNIVIERKGPVGAIILNRAHALNTLNTEFMLEISEAFQQLEHERDIYVIIITGQGKAFIAGADIKEMINLSAVQMLDWAQLGSKLNSYIENLRLPVIAAINGFALGGGCELAMACDLRIAASTAKFGLPEVGLGIIPGAGGTQRLPRLVGVTKAKELLYTGKMIGAAEAERMGLVNTVVEPVLLRAAAMETAERIAAQGQIAVQQCKRAVNAGMQSDLQTALSLELQAFSVCNATEDKRIGMGAFITKSKNKVFVYR